MAPTPLEAGCTLAGRYQVVRLVGKGGMGAVYLARDLRLPSAEWAIKEMWSEALDASDQAQARTQFEREANLLASLSHPHMPRVTDYFSEDGRQYLVMEFVEGRTLAEIVESGGAVEVERALRWALQICDLLDFLHTRSPPIIFRDVKPGNVMCTASGDIKVIDFGIARLFLPDKPDDTIALGTPGYAAPEQYGQRGQSDARSDLYGLGATLHYVLTGQDPQRTPFRFEPPSRCNAAVPLALDEVILRAVRPNAEDRWQTAVDMREALKQALVAPAPATTRPLSSLPATAPLQAPRFDPSPLNFAAVRRGEQQRLRFQIVGDVEGLLVSPQRKWLRVEPRQVKGIDPIAHATLYASALPPGRQHSTTIELRPKNGVPLVLPVDISLDGAGARGWLEFAAIVATIASLVPLLGILSAAAVVIMYLASRYEERLALRLLMLIAAVVGALNAFLCLEVFIFSRNALLSLLHRFGL